MKQITHLCSQPEIVPAFSYQPKKGGRRLLVTKWLLDTLTFRLSNSQPVTVVCKSEAEMKEVERFLRVTLPAHNVGTRVVEVFGMHGKTRASYCVDVSEVE